MMMTRRRYEMTKVHVAQKTHAAICGGGRARASRRRARAARPAPWGDGAFDSIRTGASSGLVRM